jgi:hypothetical protein
MANPERWIFSALRASGMVRNRRRIGENRGHHPAPLLPSPRCAGCRCGGASARLERPPLLPRSSAATELATNQRVRCSHGEEGFPTIEPTYERSFPTYRDVRRCRTNSDTCRNKTATAPPRDITINSIAISMNESDWPSVMNQTRVGESAATWCDSADRKSRSPEGVLIWT